MSERSSRILLAISLAFNIFIIGAATGAGYMYVSERPKSASAQRGLRFAAENLSVEQQQAFRKALAEARRNARLEIETARSSRQELARLLVQNQLDQTALNAELTKIRNADIALRTRLEQVVVSFAEALSPADRQRLVEGLRGRGGMLRQIAPKKN